MLKNNYRDSKGITLVSIIITIIILIVLAGVSLTFALKDNGILTKSKETVNEFASEVEKQQKLIDKVSDSLVNENWKSADIGSDDNEENDDETSWYSYGGEKVNTPKLIGNMKPVIYKEDLSDEKNRWANAMTSDGSLWVWIPRFAYKITSGYTATKTESSNNDEIVGNIEIKFVDKDNNFLDGSSDTIKAKTTSVTYDSKGVQEQWFVHPAFTNTPEYGGWDTELEGIWVAKFETTGTYDSNTGTGTLSVKPGLQSLRNVTVNEAYKLALSSTFGESISASDLGSHMAKNSEWGAVAYLAHSKYGTNGKKIAKNTSSGFYTGGSNSETEIYVVNKNQSTTGNPTGVYDMNGGAWEYVAGYVDWRFDIDKYRDIFNTKDYFKALGLDSSDPDYSKRKNEVCLLCRYGGSNDKNDLFTNTTSTRNTSSKYKTVYAPAGTSNTDSMTKSYELLGTRNKTFEGDSDIPITNLKKGDAIYETSSGTGKVNGNDTTNSWFKELSIYPNFTHPFFKRGGDYESSVPSGTFYFNNSDGNSNERGSFRVVLAF